MRLFVAAALLVTAAFSVPLFHLVRYALKSEIASHILLIPFISLYLFRLAPRPRLVASSPPSTVGAIIFAVSGVIAGAIYWVNRSNYTTHEALSLMAVSYLSLLFASALATLGWSALRPHRFALAFLIFAVPLPLAVTNLLSITLQYASAEAADVTLRLTGMPVFRDGLGFQLPGLRIFVAEECSGIRSTLVLFITSVLAAHLFLRTPWKKVVFVLMVFPIGVLRNAIRITSISWLTVNVDSGIIEGPLHNRGGPIFFVLSLVPLFLLLWFLRKSDPATPAEQAFEKRIV